MAEVVELQKLKLAELRQECDARGLATKGNKGELIARLQAYLDEHEDDVDVDDVLVEDAEDFTKSESDGVVNDIKDPESSVETLAEKKVVKISPASTASERLQKRAERFSLPASAESKKALRAARFGLPAEGSGSSAGLLLIFTAPLYAPPHLKIQHLQKRSVVFLTRCSHVIFLH
ncbi:SAP domain-containing ribonucleoprotein isoform X2 [Takifugu rubripes]|uniref:SAP domain-containing ribonucleoprotein isoform X2 n=1 Tax=Takifugu rubripes TaxID=31033 RepID=UPI0011455786|nr:SAP domain-containing ribonucleoprotein isoform X2 [Takifugu rubripes]